MGHRPIVRGPSRARGGVTAWGALALLALAGCGGGDPAGALTLALDAYSQLVKTPTIVLTGVVTRTPVKTTRIIVKATAGTNTALDTADGSGHFGVTVPLTPNGTTQISFTATDATGSTSPAVIVNIQQDGVAPSITGSTPTNLSDSVALNTPTIAVTLSEKPKFSVGGGFQVTRQGGVVPGSIAVSADSLTYTLTPSGPLSPNAIYSAGFVGGSDAAGNVVTSSSCFVTTPAGATVINTFTDPSNDLYSSNPPPALAPPDLVAGRFAREGSLFSAVFQFVGPRTFSETNSDQAGIILEFDMDQDSTTGQVTIKDDLFNRSATATNRFDTLSSGTKSEYLIDMEPDPAFGDSAVVVQWTGPGVGNVLGLFVPGVCGSFMSVAAPWSVLGDDDGNANVVVMAINGTTTTTGGTIYVDPMPAKGHLTLSLVAPGPVPYMGSAVMLAHRGRRWHSRLPRAPLR